MRCSCERPTKVQKDEQRQCISQGTSSGTCQGPPSLPPETRLSPFCFVGHVESEIRGFSTASGSKPSPTHPQSNSNVGRWLGGGWEHLGGDEDPSVTLDQSTLIFARKPTNRPSGGYDDEHQRLSSAQYKATWHRAHKERSDSTRILRSCHVKATPIDCVQPQHLSDSLSAMRLRSGVI